MQFATNRRVSGLLVINGQEIEAVDTITMVGLETIPSCLGSPFNFTKAWMPYIAMGQGATEPSTENKYLENEKYRMEATISYVAPNAYVANAVFNAVAVAFILREVCILDKSAGGRMAARWSLVNDLSVSAGHNVDVTCTIYIG